MPQAETQELTPKGIRKLSGGTLPKKGKLRYRLIDPATGLIHVDERRPSKDGRYRNENYGIDLPIDGDLSYNAGQEVWIDAGRGIQIHYDGIDWKGPDGRWAFRAEVRRWFSDILAAQAADLIKWVKVGAILIGITLAVLLVAVVILSGQITQGGV